MVDGKEVEVDILRHLDVSTANKKRVEDSIAYLEQQRFNLMNWIAKYNRKDYDSLPKIEEGFDGKILSALHAQEITAKNVLEAKAAVINIALAEVNTLLVRAERRLKEAA